VGAESWNFETRSGGREDHARRSTTRGGDSGRSSAEWRACDGFIRCASKEGGIFLRPFVVGGAFENDTEEEFDDIDEEEDLKDEAGEDGSDNESFSDIGMGIESSKADGATSSSETGSEPEPSVQLLDNATPTSPFFGVRLPSSWAW